MLPPAFRLGWGLVIWLDGHAACCVWLCETYIRANTYLGWPSPNTSLSARLSNFPPLQDTVDVVASISIRPQPRAHLQCGHHTPFLQFPTFLSPMPLVSLPTWSMPRTLMSLSEILSPDISKWFSPHHLSFHPPQPPLKISTQRPNSSPFMGSKTEAALLWFIQVTLSFPRIRTILNTPTLTSRWRPGRTFYRQSPSTRTRCWGLLHSATRILRAGPPPVPTSTPSMKLHTRIPPQHDTSSHHQCWVPLSSWCPRGCRHLKSCGSALSMLLMSRNSLSVILPLSGPL